MTSKHFIFLYCALLMGLSNLAHANERVRLASSPALSPDAKTIALSWRGDIWTVPVEGGNLTRITSHAALDNYAAFSPDSKQLAFCSERNGGLQLFVVSAKGGTPKQHTFHTEGCRLMDWYGDGKSFLVSAQRDHFWRHSERVIKLPGTINPREELLFDAYGTEPAVSPDGTKVLFIREGTPWWRKGYRGSQAGQLWLYDTTSKAFQRIGQSKAEFRSPLWGPDGKTIYYLSAQSGSFNLWAHCLGARKHHQLTSFEDDSVVSPCISRDGTQIVFRHLFDLYRISPKVRQTPELIDIHYAGDDLQPAVTRKVLRGAQDVAFTSDGLEIAFVAGGDVWVMDTVLKEPKQVTNTPAEESEVLFSADNNILYFLSDAGGQPDVWRAEAKDVRQGWWRNDQFKLSKITDDADTEHRLAVRPNKPKLGFLKSKPMISFLKGRGDLWVSESSGKNARRILESWNSVDYDWSPDGKWLVYAISDADFNRDVFLYEVDAEKPPFNLSRHPDDDFSPVWSPNGKTVAFLGRRTGTEVDICYVQLESRASQESSRDRKLNEAAKKFGAARRKAPAKEPPAKKPPAKDPPAKEPPAKEPPAKEPPAKEPPAKEPPAKDGEPAASKEKPKKPVPAKSNIRIDFEQIHDRIQVVSIPNSTEGNLVWSPDSKFLAFSGTVGGKAGTYTISPPADLKPKLYSTNVGTRPRWIKPGNQLTWLVKSVPSVSAPGGKSASYPFVCLQSVSLGEKHRAAFEQCWRAMRDYFYDGNLNNRDWSAIRTKYSDVAAGTTNTRDLGRVISMMLGELNGSHLGFRPGSGSTRSNEWQLVTAHLGVQFDDEFPGPGFKVSKVIFGGPASKEKSKLNPGDVIVSVGAKEIAKGVSLASIFTGPPARDLHLVVRNAEGKDRKVRIRPISYASARSLLYEQWIRDNRQMVDKASEGKLAYLHIQGMNMPSFYRFEQELYEVAGEKEGIIIDVRENGGGFTTDHLLTVLTQPVHAITVPRGGTRGYPQSRRIYATWHKPIIVLCNQNSFSNAEIFSHAIKTLKRGQLVGVPTSGSVISTGIRSIMDVGSLRIPFRGWYVHGTGDDMELNGAVPDHVLWPKPGQLPAGQDVQLSRAVELLKADVAKGQLTKESELKKASQR